MELKLDFYEDEARKIGQASRNHHIKEAQKTTKDRHLTLILFFAVAIACIPPLKYNMDFIYPCIASIALAGRYFWKTRRLRATAQEQIDNTMQEWENLIIRMRGVEGVKYVYDEEKLEYHEENKPISQVQWSKLYLVSKEEELGLLFLSFDDEEMPHLMIPAAMTSAEEFVAFKAFVQQKMEAIDFEFIG